MRSVQRFKNQSGQSLLEILVAIGIFLTFAGSVVSVLYGGQNIAADAENANRAVEFRTEGAEGLRSIKAGSWNALTDGMHGITLVGDIWQLQGASTTDSIFKRTVTITSLGSNIKIATTTVTWQTNPQRVQKIESAEMFSNWVNPAQGSCKLGPLSGNWANPQILGSADLGSGNSGTDVVVKLPYVYMSGVAATANKPDVFVFDVSDMAHPVPKPSLDIGAGGINALFLKGNYLYAASANDSQELIIFDISNPNQIAKVSAYNLVGSADALSVYVFSDTAVIGRSESAINELAFINVTNPMTPTPISEFSTGGSIRDFTANSGNLYFVSEESDPDIWVFNIINPLNPTLLTNYDIPGTTEDLSLFIQESQTGSATFNILDGNEQNELIVIGATTTEATGWYVRNRLDVGGQVKDITCVEGNLAFLATTNSGKEFFIANIANPDNISEYFSLNFPQIGSGIDFASNTVFMSVRSNDALRIITSGP